ncbi:isoprenylcysteine carboxylmethyltransferase family protein [Streptosporangium sp. NPDC051022]|uniref:methyltransferase family protein n=1 Tax=Streptosporangium sp. NPDC051022 TaxID=3155752 RepID=UPI003448E177
MSETSSSGLPAPAVTRAWTVHITSVLFLVAVVLNVLGLILHLGRAGEPPHLFAAVFVVANLVWLVLETPITFRRPSAPPREVSTLMTYGIARMATVGAAVLGPLPWQRLSPAAALPVLLFLGGVLLRLVAMRVLGQFYSHHVIRRDDHVIVRTGPYRLIRHPAYAGMLLGHVGLVLFFLNWASVPLLVVLAFAIGRRIRVEERELLAIPAYREYAAGRPRLVPGVW